MSTYSSNLRIELITTGTQAGTWGDTTNSNYQYIMEQAIAGYVSVTTAAANEALTYLNGPSATPSANTSVRAALSLNTSTGADFAVYAPPVSKLYVIKNASAFTATIYNSTVIGNTTAAGTGIAVPAGKTMTVWSDGTNFYQQNTYLSSPTLATATLSSPTMTGTPTAPTAAAGTNTTQVATTAFVTGALAAAYPIGSVYMNASNATNPATLLGFGTWVALAAGRVLIGDGGGFTAGATGGSADATVVSHTHTFSATTGAMSANATHTHTDTGHIHTLSTYFGQGDGGGQTYQAPYSNQDGNVNPAPNNFYNTTTGNANISTANTDHTHSVSGTTASAGSSGTGANLQPYLVVYMWQRTA